MQVDWVPLAGPATGLGGSRLTSLRHGEAHFGLVLHGAQRQLPEDFSDEQQRRAPRRKARGRCAARPSVVTTRRSSGSDAFSTKTAGVDGARPAAMRSVATCCGLRRGHVERDRVGGRRGRRAIRSGDWSSPARGVTKATLRARPRRVSDRPSDALAASAAVMPGTTSHSMPAAASASSSSCARPKSIGSPPFRRTTVSWVFAASTSARLMKRCSVETLAVALAHVHEARARGERQRVGMHQRVVEDDVGALEQARGAQREEVGRARAGADELDLTHAAISSTRPAATVALVASSISRKLPVARTSA